MRVKMVPIADLIPYHNNPRKNRAAVDLVASSIHEFGFQQPIVIDAGNVLVAGHTRLMAAEKLGLDKVPVVVATDLTPAQIKAYRLADNKVAEAAAWNLDALSMELAELRDMGVAVESLGWTDDELEGLLGGFDFAAVAPDEAGAELTERFTVTALADDFNEIKRKVAELLKAYNGAKIL